MCQLCQQLGLDLHKLDATDVTSDGRGAAPWTALPGGAGTDAEAPGSDSILGSTGTSSTMSSGTSMRGYVNASGDQDWYAVTLTAGQTYTFALSGFGTGALSDAYLRLLNSAGTEITFDDDSGPLANSKLTFTASTTGTYYLSAQGYGSTTGQYLLTMTTGTAPFTPVVTVGDIADYLTNTYWEVNGTVAHHWGVTTITYNVTGLSAARADLARAAFQLWSEVANLTFVETTGAAQIMLDDTQSGAFASSSYGGNGLITSASINVDPTWYGSSSAIDSYTLQTFIHEIGHALGLGHGGPYNGSATYGVDNTYANDSWQFSLMSYMDQLDYGGASYRFTMTPMMADILAIQNLYGAPTTRAGDTVYGFGSTAGSMYNFASYSSAPALTIYDSGGADTLNCSGYSQNQVINLTGGSFSNIGGLIGNIAIYTTSVIENAIGGSGADTITGNAVANVLTGNGGTDTLNGLGGDDTLNGGTGNDTMVGGTGNDIYYVDSLSDVVTENSGEGNDLAFAALSYTLASNVEHLYLIEGAGAIDALGNGLDNGILGNSSDNWLGGGSGNDSLVGGAGNDRLDGGTGADSMSGGVGNDVYWIDNVFDVINENAGEGNDLAYTSVTFTLTSNVEHLYLLEGAGAIDALGDGSNNGILGNSSDNWLGGGGGNDSLVGGAGNDRLDGGTGADVMSGGTGNDFYWVDNIFDIVNENAGEGDDLIYSSVTFTMTGNVEHLYLLEGAGAIDALGDNADNGIQGNSANNWLGGGAGNDSLVGLAGNDRLDGGIGADSLSGGTGDDFYWIDNIGDTVHELAGEGNDLVYSTVSFTLASNVEHLYLVEGVGAIDATGNALNNGIVGNSSNNVINGRGGADTLVGNGGIDTFAFNRGEANGDRITDFNGNGAGAGDQLTFVGYGSLAEGATFVQIDTTHWQINSADGLTHDVIELVNGAAIHNSDYQFL